MKKQTILVIADLGGCPPHHFYRSVAEKYHIVSYVPRPFAISKAHAKFMEEYSVAVIKDTDFLNKIEDFEHPESIYWASGDYDKGEARAALDIINIAKMFAVDAITTNNELFIVPMAKACEELGLRGAGYEAAKRARDKNLMRESFNQAGLTTIESRRVNNVDDFKQAVEEIKLPVVLKPTYLASSLGVTLIDKDCDPVEKFLATEKALEKLAVPKSVTFEAKYILEKYIEGCGKDWRDDEGYGDYVSVEGLMVNGEYVPIVINDKTPLVFPFTETSHITPSTLDHEAKEIIYDTAKKANEALGLNYCATHTEIKLMKDRKTGVIETAARFGGWNIVPQAHTSLGLNFPALLADILINGYSAKLPFDENDHLKQYSANLNLYISDFREQLAGDAKKICFNNITLPSEISSEVTVTSFSQLPPGTEVSCEKGFESLHPVASLDLLSKDARKLKEAIQTIRCQSVLSAYDARKLNGVIQ
nr:ATP-grasp domain-containing protein [Evansella caseinilytica]